MPPEQTSPLIKTLRERRTAGERRKMAGDPAGERERAQAQRAISKVLDGTYGTCDACGYGIEKDKLAAAPWLIRCAKCERRAVGRG